MPIGSARHRLLEVDPSRLCRWVDGFIEQHGIAKAAGERDLVQLDAADGSRARFAVPWPPMVFPPEDGAGSLAKALAQHALVPRTLGFMLVRRGGWAVGVARGGQLLVHKTGRRYVQGRTSAGGWSQQRYARRRDHQAGTVVAATITAAAERLTGHLDGLVIGGDRHLLDAVLTDRRLGPIAAVPRSPLLAVADPSLKVLIEAARRGCAIRVQLDEA